VDTSKSGTAAVTVEGFTVVLRGIDEESIDLSRNTDNDLSKSSNDSLTVTVTGSYDSIRWYVDEWGNQDQGTGSSYTIHSNGSIPVGLHRLTVVVVKNGVPYSKELTFRVVL
jgi:hypothetical protein